MNFYLLFLLNVITYVKSQNVPTDDKIQFQSDNNLATKLICNAGEVREFHYSNKNDLWGEAGGQIQVDLDVSVYCLGEVLGENYILPACKYLIELTNINGIPLPNKENERNKRDTNADTQNPLRRSKRGFVDWVSNTWEKVKGFFKRVFGMEESSRRESSDVIVFTDKPTTTTEKTYYDASEVEVFDPSKYQSEYGTPYEFVQLADGSIPDILFAANDTNESARNIKRHLTEIFSTSLVKNQKSKEETTPMGRHRTHYTHLKNADTVSTTVSPVNTNSDQLTVVKKFKKEDVMELTPIKGQTSKGLNKMDNVDLNTIQVQKFLHGEMVSAEGVLNMAVNQDNKRKRRKRNAEQDFNHLAVKTSFSLQLKHRQKRSLTNSRMDINELEKEMQFTTSTLGSSSSENYEVNRLSSLREKLADLPLNYLDISHDSGDDLLSTLLETIELESKLGDQQLTTSIQMDMTPKIMQRYCLDGNKKPCVLGILLAASIGGLEYENFLLELYDDFTSKSYIPHSESLLTHLAVSVSSLPVPSTGFITSVLMRISDGILDKSVSGTLASSLGSLLVKQNVPGKVRAFCFERLAALMNERTSGCPENDDSVFQLVEALGVGAVYEKVLIELSAKCSNVTIYKNKIVKSLRHSITSSLTRDWISKALDNASCEFKVNLAESLLSVAMKQRLNEVQNWPNVGFNSIDQRLGVALLKETNDLCGRGAIYKYFAFKENQKSLRVLRAYGKLKIAQGLKNRKRRSAAGRDKSFLWDDQTCDDWLNHVKGSNDPIDSFEEDGKMYNRWSHCSGKRKLGRDMANAVFDGGIFAGVKYPTSPPEFKVEATVTGEANFLGKDFELGRMGFSVNERKTKTVVELLGRHLLDLKGRNCTEDEFIYRPAVHIPLYGVNIWLVQASLGISLGVEASVDFDCPHDNDRRKYIFQPTTKVRVGGEAMGRVLMLRAGVDFGGNFNYHMKANLEPYPSTCFSAKHGNDPMSVSLESWYQFHKPLLTNKWTKRIKWRPQFLSWDFDGHHENEWLKTYCILPDDVKEANSTIRPA